jgi:serine protease Do
MAAPCFSQEDNRDKKIQSEQIIIQKDGNDSEKITIQVEGDQVTVNGKPLSDFDNERVKVKRKKMMVISDGNKIIFNGNPDELMDFGNSQPGANIKKRAFLGVVTEKDDEGARISSVSPGSAAEQAGLEAGDVITAIDGKTIDGPQTLAETIREYNPDDEITVERKVNKKYKKTKLKLGSREEETTGRNFNLGDNQVKTFIFPPITGEEGPDLPGMPDLSSLGIEIQPSKKQKLGLKIQDTEKAIGVKILELEEGTPAAQSGLKKDDVIVEINGQSIRNTDEARMELKESEKKENYHIKAERNGKVMEFDISIPRALKTINL